MKVLELQRRFLGSTPRTSFPVYLTRKRLPAHAFAFRTCMGAGTLSVGVVLFAAALHGSFQGPIL